MKGLKVEKGKVREGIEKVMEEIGVKDRRNKDRE